MSLSFSDHRGRVVDAGYAGLPSFTDIWGRSLLLATRRWGAGDPGLPARPVYFGSRGDVPAAAGSLSPLMVGGVPLDLATPSSPPSASTGGGRCGSSSAGAMQASRVSSPTPSTPASGRGETTSPGAGPLAMLGVATATEPPRMDKPAKVQPPASAVLRRSSRHAVAADGSVATDEDSLAKAMRRKALLNGQLTPGTSSKPKFFLSLSTHQLSSRLHKVGVTMGRDEKEILVSTNALKHMEFDRVKVLKERDVA